MTTQQPSKSDIEQRLEKLAYRESHPFCYQCYRRAPSGTCAFCASDDLMREAAGEGVEYGVTHVIQSLLRNNLTPVNVEEAFEESIREGYPETTKVGWLDVDTVEVLKTMDPVSWRCARSDWESFEVDAETIISFDNDQTFYWTHDIETYLDENESEEDCA